jgi:ribosomal protein S18 acetylase RimI-like enzyme
MVLDTLPEMTEAQTLYESFGFREIESYYPNPLSGVRYLALDIATP